MDSLGLGIFTVAGIQTVMHKVDSPNLFLLIFVGPLISWISSWILYAFGQLVEDTHEIRFKEDSTARTKTKYDVEEKVQHENEAPVQDSEEKAKRKVIQCECGEIYYGLYCPICGKSSKTQAPLNQNPEPIVKAQPKAPANNTATQPVRNTNKSIVCKCGERFYGDTCPNCGRTLKDL